MPTADPAPVLEKDDRGWWIRNARDGNGRLVRVGPIASKGEATALYLRVVGILPPAPRPAKETDPQDAAPRRLAGREGAR